MSEQPQLQFTQGKDYTIIQPYRIRGKIVHGFKRGSTQLGFPTANVDPKAFSSILSGADHGVYFGWAQVLPYNGGKACSEKTTESTTETTESTTETTQSSTEPAEPQTPSEKLQCADFGVFKCMLSLGKNVQFDATQDTLEAYIHHTFLNNFYDHEIELIICGYIRPQLTFDSLEALIAAIKRDVDIGDEVLENDRELSALKSDDFFEKTAQG